jgi:uncharacterized membrane protein YgaE (UPF0421/DUF939 family)
LVLAGSGFNVPPVSVSFTFILYIFVQKKKIQEEQKRNIENICIKLEVLSKLLENKEEYLTLNELSQFLKKGEDKGKQIEIPQNQPQEKISKLEETSESTQLRIKPPSNYF